MNISIKNALQELWYQTLIRLQNKSDKNHVHQHVDTASRLGTTIASLYNIGDSATPVYFENGTPKEISKIDINYGGTNAATIEGARTNLNVYSKEEVNDLIKDDLADFGIIATKDELDFVSGVTSNIQTQLNNKLASTTTYAGSSSVGGVANSSKTSTITRIGNDITYLAGALPLNTERIYFGGSDAKSFGCPTTYCIAKIQKGDNHRTIIDYYSLNTGDHYINGCLHANNSDMAEWTGWILQPNATTMANTLQSAKDYTDQKIAEAFANIAKAEEASF